MLSYIEAFQQDAHFLKAATEDSTHSFSPCSSSLQTRRITAVFGLAQGRYACE